MLCGQGVEGIRGQSRMTFGSVGQSVISESASRGQL